jgi:geranylgeranyl diphosphate synthase, type II
MDFKSYQTLINKALKSFLPPGNAYALRVRKAMEYSLMAGGKRIRPMLCLLACEAVGGKERDALPAACALEYIHTYSLIHDDLPALDNDDYRRGQRSCHKKFDEATALLAGDALLTEAFSLLSRRQVMRKIPAPIRLAVIQEIACAAGVRGMVVGQEADLAAEKKKVSLDFLQFIHCHKTGALLRASLVSGGLIGGGKPAELKGLRQFGESIGLAFQIKDDLLNVEGTARIMGKKTGTDEKKAKATYPRLMGLGPSKLLGRKLLVQAEKALKVFGERAEPLKQIGGYILSRDR